MTVFGSTCTRSLIDRTLICNAILYHFQITLYCGRINRPFIPLTFFLLSRPLEQLEFIRFSNFPAEISFVFPNSATTIYSPTQTSKVDIDDISLTSNLFFKSPMRDDLLINFLVSVFTPYKNFTSVRFNLGRMCLKQISSLLHDQIPQRISLSHPSFLRSRPARTEEDYQHRRSLLRPRRHHYYRRRRRNRRRSLSGSK